MKIFEIGIEGEALAKNYLIDRDFKILTERYISQFRRSGAGEIDIVAKKNEIYHFIEVKSRQSSEKALESLTVKQIQRLYTAVSCYFAENDLPEDTICQLSLITVANGKVTGMHQIETG